MNRAGRRWYQRIRLRFAHALLISFLIHGLILTLQFDLSDLGMSKSYESAEGSISEPPLSVVLVPEPSGVTPTGLVTPSVQNSQAVLSQDQNRHDSIESNSSLSSSTENGMPMPVPSSHAFNAEISVAQPILPPPSTISSLAKPVKTKSPHARVRPTKQVLPELREVAQPEIANASSSSTDVLPLISVPNPLQESELAVAPMVAASASVSMSVSKERSIDVQHQDALKNEVERNLLLKQEARRQEELMQDAKREEIALQEALEQEMIRREASRQEAVQQEATRQEALHKETQRQEVARQEALKLESLRQEVLKQEMIRREASRQDAAQQEATRQEALRKEVQRQEVARQEALKQEMIRREASRQEAAQQEVTRQEALRKEAQRGGNNLASGTREAGARNASVAGSNPSTIASQSGTAVNAGPNTQSDNPTKMPRERSASTENALPARPSEKKVELPPDNSRRLTLLGRMNRDARLLMLAEGWRQKVEQNADFALLKAVKTESYVDPLVKVAIRRDGSVESIVFNRSSGVPAIDNAVRQIIMKLSPFDPLPGDIAMDYDVVEIVRVWTFGDGLRLVYGGR